MNKTYFFIGINGIGMSGLAIIMAKKGAHVYGSDISSSLDINHFKSMGITVYNYHSKNHIKSDMIVVVSSAINESNEELMAAKKKNCKIFKRGEFLADFEKDFNCSIGVAGTHGKTTTTSLIAHIFSIAGLSPSYFIGGHLLNKEHAILDSKDIFISELDESDGSFLDFIADTIVVTNIESEHLDFFKTKDQLINAFKTFIEKTTKDGLCVLNLDDPISKRIYKKLDNPSSFLTFGIESNESKIIAKNIEYTWQGASFCLSINKNIIGKIQLNLLGRHNIYNALSAIALCMAQDIPLKHILEGIKTYSGVKRRLELKYKGNNILLFDDYAHHPTEILTTLEGVYKSFSKQRIITIFQPHRFSRLTKLFDKFSTSFFRSYLTIILPVFSAGEQSDLSKDSTDLVSAINLLGGNAHNCVNFDKAITKLESSIKEEDIILVMGAGDVSLISKKIIPIIQRR